MVSTPFARCFAVCGLLFAPFCRASDHNNLEENFPTRLEDAYPIDYLGREIQCAFQFTRTGEGKELFLIEPRLEWGFARNWQGTLIVPVQFGSAVRDGLGNVGLEALYNFNTDGIWLPAISISGRADLPTAPDARGVDTTAKLLLTKGLGRTSFLNELHANLAWTHNAAPAEGERENVYSLAVGWSARLNADTVGVIDYVHEQQLEEHRMSNMLEAGIRRQITPRLVLSAGAGVGLTAGSPHFRATFGFQQSF